MTVWVLTALDYHGKGQLVGIYKSKKKAEYAKEHADWDGVMSFWINEAEVI